MAEEQYTVYVRTDGEGRILDIGSDAFWRSVDGWTAIDRGSGDRYRHAQGNYLPGPVTDVYGVCRYKIAGGEIIERTEDELRADRPATEETLTTEQRLTTLEEALEMILTGVTEP